MTRENAGGVKGIPGTRYQVRAYHPLPSHYHTSHPFSVNVRTLWVSTSRTEWCLHLRTEWYDHCPNGPCTSGQSAIMCKYAPVLVHQITQVPGTYRYHVYTRIRRCVSPAPPPRWADFPCSISPQLISWRCKKRRR